MTMQQGMVLDAKKVVFNAPNANTMFKLRMQADNSNAHTVFNFIRHT